MDYPDMNALKHAKLQTRQGAAPQYPTMILHGFYVLMLLKQFDSRNNTDNSAFSLSVDLPLMYTEGNFQPANLTQFDQIWVKAT